jgi:hypothetical protein
VSYILDALTKAAQQRDRQVPVVQRLLAPAPRTRSALSAVSGRLIAVLTVNAILLAAVLVWWLRPVPAPAPPQPIAAPAPPPPPLSPRPLVKLEPLPTPAAPVENPPTPSPSPRTGAAPAPAKPSPPPPASPPPRVGTPTIQPAPPVAARPPAPPESSGLKVEALIYADAPAERMVFINGRRYREGDSIDGRLKVEEIREDGVELSDQGRRFTLRVSR